MTLTTHFMAIDPGKTTGWATWDERGKPIGFGNSPTEDLLSILKTHAPKIVILENFRIRPDKAITQIWSDLPASRVIGKLEAFCEMTGAKLVKQEPSCKETGYAWSGIKKAKSHKDSHYRDAYAHGVFYLVKNKVRSIESYLVGETVK